MNEILLLFGAEKFHLPEFLDIMMIGLFLSYRVASVIVVLEQVLGLAVFHIT